MVLPEPHGLGGVSCNLDKTRLVSGESPTDVLKS